MKLLRQLVLSAYPDYAAPLEIPEIPIHGIECDSRKVEKDFMFIAVRGAKEDGRKYLSEAVARGASAIVMDSKPENPVSVPVVQLPESREAVSRLSGVFYDQPSQQMKMVGITGTNGKTTTAYLLEHILRSQMIASGVFGTINYRFGSVVIPAVETTPGPLKLQQILSQMRAAACQVVAMEVSSHALDQDRVKGIVFKTAVFTNLTQDHLDYHGDLETYFQAKAKLFTSLPASSFAVINVDDAWGRRLVKMTQAQVLTFGINNDADHRALSVQKKFGETVVELTYGGQKALLTLPMMGAHNIYNALGAIAAAGTLGVSYEKAIQSLQSFPGVPGRLETISGGQDFAVLVDFAHTPDGLLNVLKSLQEYRKNKLILVFGCGGDRDRAKRPQMAAIAAQFCDEVIITSDNPRSENPGQIAQEISAGFPASFKAYQIALDRRKAIRLALLKARTGDIVLLAGKGHERVQVIGAESLPFSDKEEAAKVLSGH
jgi:UDP-N-acetylmuramoyl-L-alanyl-D-glutamate--2,6-diaminopimelate ligase